MTRLAVLGPQGAFTEWLVTLIRTIRHAEGIEHFYEFWPDNEEAYQNLIATSPSAPQMIGSQFPVMKLLQWLDDENIPVLVVVEDPVDCVTFQVTKFDIDIYTATRSVSHSISKISQIKNNRKNIIIHSGYGVVSVTAFADRLSKVLFGRPLNNVSKVLADLRTDEADTVAQSINIYKKSALSGKAYSCSTETIILCENILNPIRGKLIHGQMDEMFWGHEIFMDGELNKSPARPVRELVGPARCFYYGPYLHLPRGSYEGDAFIGLSDEIRETYLRLEVVMRQEITQFVARATRPGVYALAFEFVVEDPSDPIELRILNERGEIEGRLGFQGAKIRPVNR